MKMTIRTDELGRALYRVQGIADRKSTMPVLAHVLLEATAGGELSVSATDLDVGLTGKYQADVQQAGSVAVHARQLYEVVKSLSQEKLSLERTDNNWVRLQAGPSHFELVGIAANQFPTLPSHSQIKTFKVPAQELARMIDRTIFCVSTDDNRHNLSGVFCESPKKGLLRMVATDGHRLALSESELGVDIALDQGVIVPRKGFQELLRVLGDSKEGAEVEIGFSATNGLLRCGAVTLSTRLVEGSFPEYEQVIPRSSDKSVKVGRLAFTDALKRVSLLSQSRAHGVRVKLEPGKLELLAEDPEQGTAREAVDVEYKGPPLTVGFNARYLLDVMAHVADEGIVLELTDDLSPGVIKPLEEKGFLAVVMPMRI